MTKLSEETGPIPLSISYNGAPKGKIPEATVVDSEGRKEEKLVIAHCVYLE